MVSSLLVEALSSPTDVLVSFYDTYDREAINEFPKAVARYFSDIFRTEEALLEIPPLIPLRSLSSYHDRALVRFRALVQDTSPSPEMYLSKFRDGRCGGWGLLDSSQSNGDDTEFDYNDLRDCTVLWAVSVPGETVWYQTVSNGDVIDQSELPPDGLLRAHKYPIPKEAHCGVQIKMYGNIGNDVPKTADVLNFVGILNNEPQVLVAGSDEAMMVPTLHVLFTRDHRLGIPKAPEDLTQQHIGEELLDWIADEALGGDRDAAEWVLLACTSRVQSRARSLNPLSLTLAHFPSPMSSPSAVPTLSRVLSLLLPLQVTLPLSLDLLNSVPFAPESVNEDLHSGYLQLAHGTTMLMTEGGIQEGKLVERGVLNVRAIQQVISTQTLAYKFPFSEFSFPTDISFVILAQGTKSALFQTDFTLPLNPSSTSDLYKPKSNIKLPSVDKLDAFRRLVLSAKTGNIELTESISEHIQEDFVKQRRADNAISPEDLKQTITLARLIGLTKQEGVVTLEGWEHAKEMNKRRKARFT
ncbi:mini-chromosome maintenance replisome factor-domain-containing protein [Russula earlei]|uniref:Mini-chromosome maintenance replisome factor-domain-containing protein n=1 Tax=Russula earlei TaxID=71964 RepID=A0ACC0UL62_9AGAM|nr:mini-chromosome maintenance replisome factor-domain-containing protein [Russula earlei]